MTSNFKQLISLIYGGDFNIFRSQDRPPQRRGLQCRGSYVSIPLFRPFPPKNGEIINDEARQSILSLMDLVKPEMMTPFRFVTEREVSKEDKEFILKIMKMDWRDRPTAKELLQDEWFEGDEGE